jgi:hypothetical protein
MKQYKFNCAWHKGHLINCHEGTDGEKRYSSPLSLTSALDGVDVNATPWPFYPRNDPVLIAQEAGRTGLDGCGKSRPYRDFILGLSSP